MGYIQFMGRRRTEEEGRTERERGKYGSEEGKIDRELRREKKEEMTKMTERG